MFGMIARITAIAGQRDALVGILLEGLGEMPGNLSYIVAKDMADEDALWVTEVWIDKEAHARSLALPVVQRAIAQGRPLIADMQGIAETIPVGGTDLG